MTDIIDPNNPPTPVKTISWLLASILLLLCAYFGIVAPVLKPTVTLVSYLGYESPEYTALAPASSASLYLARGEVTGFFVSSAACQPFNAAPIPGVTVAGFNAIPIMLSHGSYKGALTGSHYNGLVPMADTTCIKGVSWVDVTISATMVPGAYTFTIGDLPITLTVNGYTMANTSPLYVGFTSYKAMLAHGYPSTSSTAVQGPLTLKYVNFFRAHGIEPIAQRIADPTDAGKTSSGLLNLNEWPSGSFTQTTLTGAISPPVVISGGFINQPFTSTATLTDWEATWKVTGALTGATVFLSDEPCDKNAAADACGPTPNNPDPGLVGTLARAKATRAAFPDAGQMLTHEPTSNLIGVIDHFTPIFERFKASGHWQDYTQAPGYYMYGACPSHGSCANQASQSAVSSLPSGTPEPIIDQPNIYSRMFPIVVQALGASAGYYYDSIQSWTPGNDPWVNEYEFGGEGDGTLVLPGIVGAHGVMVEQPIATIRLKMLRQGQADKFYLKKLTPAQVNTLVPDQYKWQRSHDAIDALRRAA